MIGRPDFIRQNQVNVFGYIDPKNKTLEMGTE